jgi:hypothetical protein
VFDGIGWAWTNILEPVFKALIEAGKFVVGWVRDHWPEISAKATEVFNQVKADVMTFVAFFQSLWRRVRRQHPDDDPGDLEPDQGQVPEHLR